MNFSGFTNEDFDVFTIDGLENRMNALISNVRPKLEDLGQYFAPTLSSLTGDEIFPHVAKHARRTINPPKDTWVAFANNNRGYKMLPHFQIGLWNTHLFVWFAVIYEAPIKTEFGKTLIDHIDDVKSQVPNKFVWSTDHMQPNVIPHNELDEEKLEKLFIRLQTVKKAEILCGITLQRDEVVNMGAEQLLQTIDETFRKLIPLYQLAQKSSK
ncbi:YktB family protein [Fredinandcohnia sp. 179-A 10B2 NHS]|uniref:YktB family protein n=1 Tax=Fredinandcohnia sp. 179-A 10B2 NHS TaxID=3235176 RepID=UPI0039A237F5